MKYLYRFPAYAPLLFVFFAMLRAPFANAGTGSLEKAVLLGRQDPDSAFLVLRKVHDQAITAKDNQTAGKALQEMGRLCYTLGHYPKALEYYQQAETIFIAAGKSEAIASVLNDLGQLYFRNANKKTAKEQFDKALVLYLSLNDKAGIARTYGNIGHYYEKQAVYDSAYHYQLLAQQQYHGLKNNSGIAAIYQNLGTINEDLGKYDSALCYFRKALTLIDTLTDRSAALEVINNIGDILRKTGNYKASLPFSRQALTIARETNNKYQEAAACKDIAQTYNLMGLNDSAFYYMDYSRKTQQEIYSDQNNQQMSFLRILYDTNKKNNEIMMLENKHKLNVIIFTAIGLIVALLIAVGLLIISRQKLKIGQAQSLFESKEQDNLAQKEQLELKSKQLATHTLDIIQRNQFLYDLRTSLSDMAKDDKRDQKKQLQQLVQRINQNVAQEKQWQEFTTIFEQVHQETFDKLKERCDDLTVNDRRLVALIKMNFSSADTANLLGISQDSLRVSRHRLKKKMNLQGEESLSTYIQSL